MTDRGDVDWSSLHARIARARAATLALLDPDEAEQRRILDDRARRLARPQEERSSVARQEFAFFRVGPEQFAIETKYVRRIGALSAFEPIPGAPSLFLGVINHHGDPLPLVDIRRLLAGARASSPRDDAKLSLLLVLGEVRDEVGLAISSAEDVTTLPLADVEGEHLPESLRDFAFIRGVHLGRRLVLAGEALLQDPRLVC
jgi:chemotaxis signal transduction protein